MHFGKFLNALKKINKWHVIALTALLLVANLTMMGISFARYRSAFEGSVEVGVIGFSPALEEDAFEGDLKQIEQTLRADAVFSSRNGLSERMKKYQSLKLLVNRKENEIVKQVRNLL